MKYMHSSVGLCLLFAALVASVPRSGYAAEVSSVTSGNWNASSTWDSARIPAATDNVTIAAAHVVTGSALAQYAVSNLTVNGTLTHGIDLKIDLIINGNLVIPNGGVINANLKSSSATGGGQSASRGGSYGGFGGCQNSGYAQGCVVYGSITNPTTPGSYGHTPSFYGGGLVILRIAGSTTLNGTIMADGHRSYGGSYTGFGSGGGINIITATLTGTGTNSANGGEGGSSNTGGGGGRIAVKLTTGNSFDSVVMKAPGGSAGCSCPGAAGTIYLQTASQGDSNGTLIVDNGGTTTPVYVPTKITTNVSGVTIGNVYVRGQGQLAASDDAPFRFKGCFTNDNNGLINSFNGPLIVDGTGTCVFAGSQVTNVFQNLTCTNADKQIAFKAGSLYSITNILTLRGNTTNHPVYLRSSTPGIQWRLNIGVNEHVIWNVDVQDSDARTGTVVQATDSTDNGNNSNWVFSVNGATNTWSGGTDTNWGNGVNWSLSHEPTAVEVTQIPTGMPRYPSLNADKILSVVRIASGASVNLNGRNFTVKEMLSVSGMVTATGGETVSLQGSADLTAGTIAWSTGSVCKLTGTGNQTITVDGDTFRQLTVENGSGTNTFVGSLSATGLTCQASGATLVFAAGATYTVGELTLYGREAGRITLRSSSPGTKWNLNVTGRSRVAAVNATDSDAGGGQTIYPVMSINGGNNTNWVFGADSWKRWTGASSTAFGTAGNWSPSGVPGPTNRVWIDGNYASAPNIAATITVPQMVLGGSAAVTLTADKPLIVLQGMEMWTNVTVTHTLNSDNSCKVDFTVGSNLVMDVGSAINVNLKSQSATGAGFYGNRGGSHGGFGGCAVVGEATNCVTYGSITNPTALGSYGHDTATYGGGAVILRVAGNTTLNGAIIADAPMPGHGQYRGCGSGGSINIVTATLSGSSTNSACGGIYSAGTSFGNAGGGGGRIAVILTVGNSFDNVTNKASGGSFGCSYIGAAGTIYLQTASQGVGNGTLIVDNNGATPPAYVVTKITTNVSGATVGDVIVTNLARLAVGGGQTLTIQGSLINRGYVSSDTNGTYLFAGTNVVTVMGSNSFGNLECSVRGKTMQFEAGKTNTVSGKLTFNGPNLLSTVLGNYWYLTLLNAGDQYQNVQRVQVQDSNAGGGATITILRGGADFGHNVNWKFAARGAIFSIR